MADDRQTVLALVIKGLFSPPRRIDATIPRGLAAFCSKAMARQPNHRYCSAIAVALDCERWLADEPVEALGETASQRTQRWQRRQQVVVQLDSRECEFVRSLARAKGLTDAAIIEEWVRQKLNEGRTRA